MHPLFKEAGKKIAIIQVYNSGNKIITTKKSISRILLFISLITFNLNPLEVGIVEKIEDYIYSSAEDHHF